MKLPEDGNFAGHLVRRLGDDSHLTDAATGQSVRGRAVAESIVGFADGFRATGLEPGDRIVVCCGLNTVSALAYLGAMYAGVVPVLVADRGLAALGEKLFRKSGAKAVWTAKEVRCDWMKSNGIIAIKEMFEPRPAHSLSPVSRNEQDVAALMPTSGSTGEPRLVAVSHLNLRANTEAIVRSQFLRDNESAMLVMPINYCFGASVMHTHLYQGGGVVLDSRFMFPDKVLHAINTYGCTTFAGVPTVYNILLRRSSLRSIPLPNLRRFLQAGGPLAGERVQEMRRQYPGAEFFVMYGQTEATARISCMPASFWPEKLGSVGRPLDNLKIRVVDEEGQELSAGKTGELQVRGPSVCCGYFNDPEATAQKFSNGWLRTGDLATRDNGGFLWIIGRTGDFIKTRGVRVSFAEVEAKVAALPGIYECAATAVGHPEAGEALALFVVPDRGACVLAESIRRALHPQWTCDSVHVVAELPKTSNGKIARSQLPAVQPSDLWKSN